MIRKKCKPYVKVVIQIFLIVSMSWAFSYIIHSTDNLVSAQGEAINTCLKTKDEYGGAVCLEYSPEECANKCETDCLPMTKEEYSECKSGDCYDDVTGICSKGAPKGECENKGGKWGVNLNECNEGCCIVGESQTMMTTAKTCDLFDFSEFNLNIKTTQECAQEKNLRIEGACVIYEGEKKTCEFGTKEKCDGFESESASVMFKPNYLCSHPELEMNYTKQSSTGCVEGRYEVYWFDDQGNRENIYEGSSTEDKESSWNNGKIKSKSNSCDLGIFEVGVVGGCGNCDEFDTSSKCGYNDNGEAVCLDLSCEWNGKTYQDGESWCYYQGSVLPKEGSLGLNRSTVVPGSRQFKMWCDDGQIYNYSCKDYRTEICEQNIITRDDDSSYSMADCRPNFAIACISYNTFEDKAEGMELCGKNPDCFIKEVRINHSPFNFNICVAKYPLGFDTSSPNPFQNGEAICELATVTCETARVKKIDGHVKTINEGCKGELFLEQMNDFCMSLGDCGGSVNYIGEYSDDGYLLSSVATKPQNSPYVNSIKEYSGEYDEYIQKANPEEIYYSVMQEGDLEELKMEVALETLSESVKERMKKINSDVMAIGTPLFAIGTALLPLWPIGTLIGGILIGITALAKLGAYLLKSTGVAAGLTPNQARTLVISMIFIPTVTLSIIGLMKLTGVGKVKKTTIVFQCMPWQPKQGGEDCGKCYESGFGCSEYSCRSLGTLCEFYNEGTSFETCEAAEEDMNPPTINPLMGVLSEGFAYEDISNRGFRIVSDTENGCIPAFTPVTIGLELNKRGRCTFSVGEEVFKEKDIIGWIDEEKGDLYTPKDYGISGDLFKGLVTSEESLYGDESEYEEETWENEVNTEFWFGGSSLYFYNLTHFLYLPSLNSLDVEGFDPDAEATFDMNVRCEDRNGNTYPMDYTIRMCISPEKRFAEPVIVDKEPILVNSNTTIAKFSIYTDYPSDCKWDLEDKEYELMENDFLCENEPEDITISQKGIFGFKCDSDIEVDSEEVTIFASCRDQPWEIEENRNTMKDSEEFTIKKSEGLEIDSITLNDNKELEFGTDVAVVEIEIETLGGGDNGNADCRYKLDWTYTPFDVTGGTTHTQNFNQMTGGDKKILVKCEDEIGNIAIKEKEFTINIDHDAPIVTRAYKDGTKLELITNEKAFCYYDFKKCNFDIEEAESMSYEKSKTHTTNWISGATYYIKCKDEWDNYDSKCSIIVKAEDI